MSAATENAIALPSAGDEGWRGTALRALEGLTLPSQATASALGRLAPVLESARKTRPDAVVVEPTTDGGAELRREEGAIGPASAPGWAGWAAGFLWSSRLQETTSGRGLVAKVRGKRAFVLVGTGAGVSAARFDVEAGAEVDVVDLRESTAADALAASRVRIAVGSGATVRWFRAVAGEGARADDVEVEISAGGRLEWANVAAAGRLTRTDARVFLRGKDASFLLNGLSVADGTAVADFRIGIEHGAPATTSQQEFRTLANRQGASLFHGRVVIPPGNPGVEAHQQAPSLLLGRGARVQSRPQLEIHTDEVACSHGATVGELDATALFYLRSRGLDAEAARRLLVEGFARAVLEPWSRVVDPRVLDGLWQGGVA